ncbi:MAG: PAS domain-containing protein [Phycisphaerales bacterium]|nr:PAS domain-containing protein [Phycisphaerales bacterium]
MTTERPTRRLVWAWLGVALALLAAAWVAVPMGAPSALVAALASLAALTAAVTAAWGLHASAAERAAREARARADETSQRQARTRSDALRALLDAVDEPIVGVDGAGTVVIANRAAVSLLATGSRPLEGRPVEDLLPQPELVSLVANAASGRAGRDTVRIADGDSVRIFEAFAAPARFGPEPDRATGAALALRDVTEHAATVQLKTDFVANASHELRTPLASIRTALDTLREFGDEDPSIRERMVHLAASNAARLEELVADLLDLSRLESPEARAAIERCAASEIVRALRADFEPACARRNLALSFEVDPALEALDTDPRLLTLILRNLIDNAVKFAHEGTTVRVVAGFAPDGGARRTARFEVIDRGIGIPLAQQQRVFERFYQVDAARSGRRERRGTGLGLAIVKHAVRALGGSVSLRSVWGQGTTVTVDLPGAAPNSEPPSPPPTPARDPSVTTRADAPPRP